MRTAYMRERRTVVLGSDFRKDLGRLQELSREHLATLVQAYIDYMLADKTEEEDEIAAEAAADLAIDDMERLNSLFRVTEFLRRGLEPVEASAEELSADLRELGVADEAAQADLEWFLGELQRAYRSRAASTNLRRVAQRKVIPRLAGISTVADMRAVFGNEHTFGEPSADYEPSILEVAPLVVMRIRVSGVDEDREFCLQVDESELQNMIDALIAAAKELEALRAFCGRGDSE